jgi:hypothetical protein
VGFTNSVQWHSQPDRHSIYPGSPFLNQRGKVKNRPTSNIHGRNDTTCPLVIRFERTKHSIVSSIAQCLRQVDHNLTLLHGPGCYINHFPLGSSQLLHFRASKYFESVCCKDSSQIARSSGEHLFRWPRSLFTFIRFCMLRRRSFSACWSSWYSN